MSLVLDKTKPVVADEVRIRDEEYFNKSTKELERAYRQYFSKENRQIDTYVFDGVKMTLDEYLDLPEDDIHYEYVDGRCVAKAMPMIRHQLVSRWLMKLIDSFLESHNLGVILFEGTRVKQKYGNVREPDLVVVLNDNKRRFDINSKSYEGVPDLVIEIISDSNKYVDLNDKKKEYEALGIKEYWIIDPHRTYTHFYIFEDGRYLETFPQEGIYKSFSLLGLRFRLSDMYNVVDTKKLKDDSFYEASFGAIKLEGIKEGKLETARNLLKLGVDVEIIKESTNLSLEEINNIR